MAANGFSDYRLAVGSLVTNPQSLSLAELRALGGQRQITRHNCIQGWAAIAEWAGAPLARLTEEVRPARSARYVIFYAMGDKGLTEREGRHGCFYAASRCTWPPIRRPSGLGDERRPAAGRARRASWPRTYG